MQDTPRGSQSGGGPMPGRAATRQRPSLPEGLESAFYAYLGFPDSDNRACQALYADRFAGCERVLDVACGRGEFLDLLRERGIHGVGVDSDTGMVRQVRERGLEVVEEDALAYLAQDQPLFDGIYCAHFVEHLAPGDVLRLLAQARSRMRPGGVLILATPNAACLHTQLVEFWRDLTHVRPYTLELLRFLVTYSGFTVAEAGGNPLRLLPRDPLGPHVEDARVAVAAAEDGVQRRVTPPGPDSEPASPSGLPMGSPARTALRQARDRVSGTAPLSREIDALRQRVAALEERLTGADHDDLRLIVALRALHDVMGAGLRELDGLFPSPEVFVMGIRTDDAIALAESGEG